jgi:hypothetical protein
VNVGRIETLSSVMRGLDPRIHLFREKMDCRVKPGNDEDASPDNMKGKPECP